MEVHLTPELEARLINLAAKSGRAIDELVRDAMAGYLGDLASVHDMLDSRYDDIKSGRVKPIDGEAFFENLGQTDDELLKKRSPQ